MNVSKLIDRIKERFSRLSMTRIGIGLIALFIVLFFAVRIYGYLVKEEVKSIDKIQGESGIPVDVAEAKIGSLEVYRSFSGTIRGMLQSELTTNLTTRVTKIHFGEGDKVKKGDVIVSLNPDDPGMSTGHYRQDKATYLQALRNYQRVKELYEVGAVSKSEYEIALTTYEVARADYDASKDSVKISSPIDGIVTEITVSEGDPIVSGEIIATVAIIDKVRVELNISSSRALFIKKGQPARVVLKTPEKTVTVTGEVETISLSANKNTGLFEAKILLDNNEGLLKPGTITNLEILIYSAEDVLIIPKKALVETGDETFVFVVNSESKAVKKKVVSGWENDENTEVKEGLKVGDRVVIRGQNRLSDEENLVLIHNKDK
ncbi:MAG: efflux RND transporter periplasmic adaptor subunit [Deltaproteobacteria bacterium]|uniref:Efflux RND transporter periplasmic adaptor subunit n=1 Tax=Candidatus Zymogenus saltonus TaxID=2844893 RepID=A0A9D8KEK7_9DELT|nr:efflux RND transporter periplasmic adaptor subunit [Candidatus Zymogenus saltonus]